MTCETTALAIAFMVSVILNMTLIFASLGKNDPPPGPDEPPTEPLEEPLVATVESPA